jgi:hypothetical protein
MKKNKIISDSQLGKAFKDIPLENLSAGFVENLMSEIEKEAVRRKKQQKLIVVLQIIAGIGSMLLLPVLAVRLCNIFIPNFSFSFDDINIRFDPNYIVIGLAILLLLIIDSLYRKHKEI